MVCCPRISGTPSMSGPHVALVVPILTKPERLSRNTTVKKFNSFLFIVKAKKSVINVITSVIQFSVHGLE